jgi:hypothetical protein
MRIDDLGKVDVLIALYNRATQVPGLRKYPSMPLSRDEVQKIVDSGRTHFDYWLGRVMKITLNDRELDVSGYNSANGERAAEEAIEKLRQGNATAADTRGAAPK